MGNAGACKHTSNKPIPKLQGILTCMARQWLVSTKTNHIVTGTFSSQTGDLRANFAYYSAQDKPLRHLKGTDSQSDVKVNPLQNYGS